MTCERASTKIYIPHPNQPELSICGVLEQYVPGTETKDRKLALVRTIVIRLSDFRNNHFMMTNRNENGSMVLWVFCTSDGSCAIKFVFETCVRIWLQILHGTMGWANWWCAVLHLCFLLGKDCPGIGTPFHHCLKETDQSILISVFQPQGLPVSTSSRASLADGLVSFRFPVCSCSFHHSLIDSYPYCRRGNHETGGTWKQGALEEDLEDLNAVVAYLQSKYGYKIELVVGHSRGSLVGFRWISTTEIGRKVPAFINVSGRYRMWVSMKSQIFCCAPQIPFYHFAHSNFLSLYLLLLSHGSPCNNYPSPNPSNLNERLNHLKRKYWVTIYLLVPLLFYFCRFRRWFLLPSVPSSVLCNTLLFLVGCGILASDGCIPSPNGSMLESAGSQRWSESFAKQGYYEWHVTVARKPIVARIYPHDVEKFCSWNTSIIWEQFPSETDVLTLHGLADTIVPPWVFPLSLVSVFLWNCGNLKGNVTGSTNFLWLMCKWMMHIWQLLVFNRYDALIYAKALGSRTPGTHSLHLMEDADHNFSKRQDDVVDVILQWWEARQRNKLLTGIWLPDIKGNNSAKL